VRGFDECGYDDVDTVEQIEIVIQDDQQQGHSGQHKDVGYVNDKIQ